MTINNKTFTIKCNNCEKETSLFEDNNKFIKHDNGNVYISASVYYNSATLSIECECCGNKIGNW